MRSKSSPRPSEKTTSPRRASSDAESLKLLRSLAEAENERDGLRARNAELLTEILNLNQKLQAERQEQLDLRLQAQRARQDAQRLDLEVRELKRRLRELEGGPPLSAVEAAPSSRREEGPDGQSPPDAASVEPEPSVELADLQEALRRTREQAAGRSGAARAALEALFRPVAPEPPPAPKQRRPAAKQPSARKPAPAKPAPARKPAAARKPAPAKKPAPSRKPAPPKKPAPARPKKQPASRKARGGARRRGKR